MKKTICYFALFLYTPFVWSQDLDKKTLTMNPFLGLKVYSKIKINLIASDANKAIVYGENSDFVVLSSKEKILKIRISGGNILSSGTTKIDLYYSRPLDFIGAYQQSEVSSSFPIKQTSLSLESKSNSIIDFEVYCDRLDTNVSHGGKAFLSGKVINHVFFLGPSGICEAEKLITDQTKTKSLGGAYAYVHARNLIEAKLYGGRLRVYGSPNKRITQELLGGKVIIEK